MIPKSLFIVPLVFLLAFVSLFLSYAQAAEPKPYDIQVHTEIQETILPAKTPSSTVTTATPEKTLSSTSQTDEKFDINSATTAQLESLPGIGPKKAATIQSYIQENGPIETAEELLNVDGIGPKTLEKIRPFIIN